LQVERHEVQFALAMTFVITAGSLPGEGVEGGGE